MKMNDNTVHEAPRQQLIVYTLPSTTMPSMRRSRTGRLPRIARLMALAIRFDDLLRRETVKDCSELARLGGVSPARVSQIMNLLNLAPDIQERLLFLTPVHTWRDELNERAVRAVLREPVWARQRQRFSRLLRGGDLSATEENPQS
jgi:hypothetical protein